MIKKIECSDDVIVLLEEPILKFGVEKGQKKGMRERERQIDFGLFGELARFLANARNDQQPTEDTALKSTPL